MKLLNDCLKNILKSEAIQLEYLLFLLFSTFIIDFQFNRKQMMLSPVETASVKL